MVFEPESIARLRKIRKPVTPIKLPERALPEFVPETIARAEVPEPIEEPEFEPEEQATIDELLGRIYEGYEPITLQFIKNWAIEEPEAFLDDMIRNRGRTPDTELMLELFGATPEIIDELFAPPPTPEPLKIPVGGYSFVEEVDGVRRRFTISEDYLVKLENTTVGKYNPDTGTLESWGTQQTVVPVDGIRTLLTITPDNRAYDENNNFLGTYNAVTQEIDTVSTLGKASEVWDALIFGSRQMWELGENYFLSALPNLVFADTSPKFREIYGDEYSDRVDSVQNSIRDKFRSAYAGNKSEYEKWLDKNIELQPRIDYAEGVTKHIELITDPWYWGYEFANIVPFCGAVVASSIVAGALTGGNPLAMIAGGAAIVYPVETQSVFEALLANGASEEQAAQIAAPSGIIIASLESLGRLPLLKAVSPHLMRLFRKEAAGELGKLTARQLVIKGIKTAGATELSEVITEVLQEATQNAAVRIINENQSIFENLDVIAAKTAIATAPLSLLGGGASMRRVAPSETQGLTDAELQKMGFIKEPESDVWFQPVKVTEEAITPITLAEQVGLEITEMEAEVEGLKEWLATEPAARLVSLIKRTGWYKGEISNLTKAQYKKITGKAPLDTILTKDKKHVRWEYALDDIATEMGYESGDVLRAEIERAGENLARIRELEREIAVTEVPAVPEAIEEVPPPIEKAPIPQGVAEANPIVKDITVVEKVRPVRKVFTTMGLWRAVFKPIQKAEVEHGEELKATTKYIKEARDLVEDKTRIPQVMEALENPALVKFLTVGEKRAFARLKALFDSWADILDLSKEKRIKNYVTHIFEADMTQQIKEGKPLDNNIASVLDDKAPSTIFNPFLQERFGRETGIIKDPFLAAEAYAKRQIKIFYYEPLLEKISLLANDPKTPELAAKYLNDYTRRMTGEMSDSDKGFNNLFRKFAEKVRNRPGGERLYQVLTQGNFMGSVSYNLASGMYFLWLGFKATSAIRNLSQHTLIIANCGPRYFAEGIALRFTKEGRAALDQSLVWRGRRAAFIPGIDDSFAPKWTDTVRDTALWLFRKADEQNVKDAFLAGYAEAKAKMPNATEQELIDYGDEVAARTQYLYTKMNSMAVAQSGMGRVFSVLTTWAENWVELIGDWITKNPSQVFLEYEARTGEKVSREAWSSSYKAIGMYMAIVALSYWIKEETRLKAWEYTGITSIRYLSDIMGGDFPGLEIPGAIASVVAGFLTDDERMMKSGWSQFTRTITPGVVRQVDYWATGERDWLTLLLYLEGQDYKIRKLKEDWKEETEAYPLFKDKDGEYDPELYREWIRTHPQQAGWSEAKIRNQWREDNPKLEAKMFITNQFTILSTDKAREEVLRLIEEHNLDTEQIKGYDKVFPLDTSEELDEFTDRIGNLEKLEVGVEAEYYTTNDFATEVNRLVSTVGRTKVEQDGSAFAIEYLLAKDSWEAYYVLSDEGKILHRQQFPDVEASLYLFGKVASFKNPKSSDILLDLMEKYDIPPEGIKAFVDKPERYDALFTKEYTLKKKWFDLTTEYDNFSNPESANYIEDKDLRKEAREELKVANPEWMADMRRVEAIQHDATDVIVESWAERGKVIDEFEAGSSEAMVWLLDNPEVHTWALDQKLLTDDGSDWNVPVLRLNKKWREFDDKYLGYGDETSEFYILDDTLRQQSRDNLLLNDEYRKDRRRREAYGDDFSEGQIENFVGYHELPVKGYRQEQFLLDNPEFAKEMHIIKGIDLPEPAKIPSPKYDEIYESRPDDFDKLWGLADSDSPYYIENVAEREEARNSMLYNKQGYPTDLFRDLKRLDAYKLFIPEKHIEAYVRMAVEPDKGFRDERYLKENPDFYRDVWLGIMKNDPVDFSKIPAKEYDDIYDQFRTQFDEWDAYKDPDSPLYKADPDERAKARDRLLLDIAFAEAMIRRTGYKVLIGHEEHIDSYVTYYQILAKGKPEYEDDWFLMENKEFYIAIRRSLDWERRDFEKVPTREVFRLYQIYRRLDKGKMRENYRAQHYKLDKWMVLTGKVSKTVEEQEELSELSKAERLALKLWEQEQAREEERLEARKTIEEMLAEIERKLRRLTK